MESSDSSQQSSRGETRSETQPGTSRSPAGEGPEHEAGRDRGQASGRDAGDRRGLGKLRSLLRRQFAVQMENVIPEDVQQVLDQLEDRLENIRNSQEVDQTDRVLNRVRLMGKMLRSWSEGSFTMPWRSFAAVSACLVYVTNPLDILPDILKGRHDDEEAILDDALVIYLCYTLLEQDLRRFVDEHDLDPSEYGFEGSTPAL